MTSLTDARKRAVEAAYAMNMYSPGQPTISSQVRAYISAYEAEMRESGFEFMPHTPTREMVFAAAEVLSAPWDKNTSKEYQMIVAAFNAFKDSSQ